MTFSEALRWLCNSTSNYATITRKAWDDTFLHFDGDCVLTNGTELYLTYVDIIATDWVFICKD